MESIPYDLLIKIGNLLSTRERARLTLVSKEWQRVVADSWTTIRLEPATSYDEEEAFERGKHLAWLGRLARRSPHTLQSVYIHPLPAPHCLLPEFALHCFTRLQRLELMPQHRGGNLYSASITPEAMQCLSLLVHLEVLSLSLVGSPRYFALQGWKELLLHGIAILPKLQHLNLGLDSTVRWTVMHLHESGFPSLNSLCIEGLDSWNPRWMPEVVSRLESLCLAVYKPVNQVTDTSDALKLTSLKYRSLHRGHPSLTSLLPFKTSANLRMLSMLNVSVQKNMQTVNCNIASLHLISVRQSSDIIRSWSTLRGLTELRVGCSLLMGECVMQPFTNLSTLKSLSILGCSPEHTSVRIFEPHDGILENLTSLTINMDSHAATYNVGDMASMLPALRDLPLNITQGDLTGKICSSILEVLSVRFSRLLGQWPQASLLGELPCLHTLTLLTHKGFYEAKAMIAPSLPALKNLKELTLLLVVETSSPLPRRENTIDDILEALAAVTGLTALKIFLPISDMNLSLVNFPSLMTLSVACKAVKIDGLGIGSSLQRKDILLDLQFVEMSGRVFDHFQACQYSVVRRPDHHDGNRLEYFNVRIRANCTLKAEAPFRLKDSCFGLGMVRFLRKNAGIYPYLDTDEDVRQHMHM